jgi:hypothetical protein
MYINYQHVPPMHINLYHTMDINQVPKPIPCHVPYHASTMYNIVYNDHVSNLYYLMHQPYTISLMICINYVIHHNISSMKFINHNQDRHNTKIPIYPRCASNQCTITSSRCDQDVSQTMCLKYVPTSINHVPRDTIKHVPYHS